MVDEIWKDIEGYEGYYKVSNLGRVKSLPRVIYRVKDGRKMTIKGKIMTPTINSRGYYGVRLSIDGIGRTAKVHGLVANAFLDNPQNLVEINHKDGDKSNNHINNLEWSTRQKNIKHAFDNGLNSNVGSRNGRSIVNEEDVITIRKRKADGEKFKFVYNDYKDIMTKSGFHCIWYYNNWKHIKI